MTHVPLFLFALDVCHLSSACTICGEGQATMLATCHLFVVKFVITSGAVQHDLSLSNRCIVGWVSSHLSHCCLYTPSLGGIAALLSDCCILLPQVRRGQHHAQNAIFKMWDLGNFLEPLKGLQSAVAAYGYRKPGVVWALR